MAEVRETVEKARNNPKDFEAQIRAARVYDQIGRTNEAVEFMKAGYEVDPARAATDYNIPAYVGDWHFKQMDYINAETWFRRALEHAPNDGDLLTELGVTFLQREPPDLDRGIQYIQSALKTNAKNAHALMHLGQAYLMKKDAKGTEEAINRLREAEPQNQNVQVLQTQLEALKAGRPVVIPKEQ